jgi:hypothetical protein
MTDADPGALILQRLDYMYSKPGDKVLLGIDRDGEFVALFTIGQLRAALASRASSAPSPTPEAAKLIPEAVRRALQWTLDFRALRLGLGDEQVIRDFCASSQPSARQAPEANDG